MFDKKIRKNCLSRDTIVSRAKFTRSARRIVYLYARPKIETSREYHNNGWADWVNIPLIDDNFFWKVKLLFCFDFEKNVYLTPFFYLFLKKGNFW